jgi:hypothetical protein
MSVDTGWEYEGGAGGSSTKGIIHVLLVDGLIEEEEGGEVERDCKEK